MVYKSYNCLRDFMMSQNGSHKKLVSVDGASHSGKTTVAMKLARDLRGVRVSSDCYVKADSSGAYLGRLALDFLADDLMRLKEVFPILFFEGICVRDVLEKLGIEAALSIYIKKIATSGLWHFDFDLESFANGSAAQLYEDEPFRSDYEYHYRVRPHESSDVTYVRVAD